MSGEAFADLKQALVDALAFERGEHRDLNGTRIEVSRRPKASRKMRSDEKLNQPSRRADTLTNTSQV